MGVTVEPMTGEEIEYAIDDLARLRIEVFADFPYLYDGDLVYEAQYLRLIEVRDPLGYVLQSTWLGPLYVATGLLEPERLRALDAAVARLCSAYGVDPAPFHPGP